MWVNTAASRSGDGWALGAVALDRRFRLPSLLLFVVLGGIVPRFRLGPRGPCLGQPPRIHGKRTNTEAPDAARWCIGALCVGDRNGLALYQ